MNNKISQYIYDNRTDTYDCEFVTNRELAKFNKQGYFVREYNLMYEYFTMVNGKWVGLEIGINEDSPVANNLLAMIEEQQNNG